MHIIQTLQCLCGDVESFGRLASYALLRNGGIVPAPGYIFLIARLFSFELLDAAINYVSFTSSVLPNNTDYNNTPLLLVVEIATAV
jgi:hypothetical protein